MTVQFFSFDISSVEPEIGGPAADRLISGWPVFRTWNLEERPGGLFAGVWESTPGVWCIQYDEWEYCRILSGVSIITETANPPRRVTAGDSFFIRPGFSGTWEVVETTRKEYVVHL
jgi:uncharacterized cupin superfamily protein